MATTAASQAWPRPETVVLLLILLQLCGHKVWARTRLEAVSEILAAEANPTTAFDAFRQRFGKSYANQAEATSRQQTFVENILKMKAINDLNLDYWAGINEYADLTASEFQQLLGFKSPGSPPMDMDDATATVGRRLHLLPGVTGNNSATTTVDWRLNGKLPAIKNQGQCGSCWAFSAAACVENVQAIMSNTTARALSEQQLVDCDGRSSGCNGGIMHNAFRHVVENQGITGGSVYPYKQVQETCKTSLASQAYAKISGYKSVTGSEAALMQAVAKQVVAAAVQASSTAFQYYGGGVFNNFQACGDNIDHAINVVGYNTDGNYWIIRNSWGRSWGMDGYMQLSMGTPTGYPKGACGILSYLVYPQMNSNSVVNPPGEDTGTGAAAMAARTSTWLALILSIVGLLAGMPAW